MAKDGRCDGGGRRRKGESPLFGCPNNGLGNSCEKLKSYDAARILIHCCCTVHRATESRIVEYSEPGYVAHKHIQCTEFGYITDLLLTLTSAVVAEWF